MNEKQPRETARIELIEDRAAIADLIYTYARNIRAGNGADCVKLFTEHAVFEVREAPLGSREAHRTRARLVGHQMITDYLVGSASSETRVCPMIHNLLIRVDGSEAEGNCVMTAYVSSGQRLIGEYNDHFRHEGDWRFSSRIFTILGDMRS
jgi:SnoaL-like domain